jgi:hypothetical protein
MSRADHTEPIAAVPRWKPRPVHHSGPLPVLRTVIDGQVITPAPAVTGVHLDRPYPVWGAAGGYVITCDGPGDGTDGKPACTAVFECPEPAGPVDALTEYLRAAALNEGWSLHSGCHQRYSCLLCPACQEKRRRDALFLGDDREDSERWLAMHVEGLKPRDEGIYSRQMRFEIAMDEIRIRARDAETSGAGYRRGVAA